MLVPILISLGFFALIFGIVYMTKRESLAMIEKGMNPKMYRPAPYNTLKWGLLLVGSGLGLLLAYVLDSFVIHHPSSVYNYLRPNPAIYFALIATGGGIGLIFSYRIEKKELLDKESGVGSRES